MVNDNAQHERIKQVEISRPSSGELILVHALALFVPREGVEVKYMYDNEYIFLQLL